MLSVLFAESADNMERLVGFYAPAAKRILDVTHGSGTLTKRLSSVRVFGVDRDLETRPTVWADSRWLPFGSGVFDAAIYDPPYLYGSFAAHMGPIGEKTWSNIRSTWKTPMDLVTTSEAVALELSRVLTDDGIAFCKIMDSRFKGRLVRNHDIVTTAFEARGFVLRDQLVYIRTVTGSYVNARSAQSTHGYFLVLARDRQMRLTA